MNQNEYEIRESQRLRELEEYKGRAAQMEKTMKWYYHELFIVNDLISKIYIFFFVLFSVSRFKVERLYKQLVRCFNVIQ